MEVHAEDARAATNGTQPRDLGVIPIALSKSITVSSSVSSRHGTAGGVGWRSLGQHLYFEQTDSAATE
jgi:hypothetical protein